MSDEQFTISDGEYGVRWRKLQQQMAENDCELLFAYSDDQAFAGAGTVRYLCDYAAHFEPAVFVMAQAGDPVLVTGPECQDLDGDGYGNPAANCGFVQVDCDDDPSDDPAVCSSCACDTATCAPCARCINPGAKEFTTDGSLDSDCDGNPNCGTMVFGNDQRTWGNVAANMALYLIPFAGYFVLRKRGKNMKGKAATHSLSRPFAWLLVFLVSLAVVFGPLAGGVSSAWAADAVYYVYNDHLGTPVKATDNAGTLVWDATAKPFGEADVSTETITQNVRMPGQYFDQESGLHYNYQRTYHPGLGRYLEPDPLGQRDSANVYPYALSNPINLTDSTGQAADIILDGIFIGKDIYNIFYGDKCERGDNIKALGLDLLGAALPFATGLGVAYKAGKALGHVDDITDIATAAKRGKVIVIGEGMDDIKKAARSLRKQGKNAKWYQAWGKYFQKENFDMAKSLNRNERWIKTKMNEGYEIFDIGIDPTRARRSPFYELERDLIKKSNYPTNPLARP